MDFGRKYPIHSKIMTSEKLIGIVFQLLGYGLYLNHDIELKTYLFEHMCATINKILKLVNK